MASYDDTPQSIYLNFTDFSKGKSSTILGAVIIGKISTILGAVITGMGGGS